MQYRAREFIQPRLKQRQKTRMRIPTVHKNGHLQLSGNAQLRLECAFLFLRRGKITIEVQTTFANRHHVRLACQSNDRIFSF